MDQPPASPEGAYRETAYPSTRNEGGGGDRRGLSGKRLSDAHGRGKRAVRPAPRHAKLAVNAGFAVAGFLIDTHIEGTAARIGDMLVTRPVWPVWS